LIELCNIIDMNIIGKIQKVQRN